MKTRIGRVIILVDNYDDAFNFYENNFFCKKIHDTTTEDGQRYLHAGFAENDETGIWFLKADSTDQVNRIGKQTAGQPTLVIYTDDIDHLYNHLLSNGVEIIEKIAVTPESKYFHCLDLYGNRLTVVQLTA